MVKEKEHLRISNIGENIIITHTYKHNFFKQEILHNISGKTIDNYFCDFYIIATACESKTFHITF